MKLLLFAITFLGVAAQGFAAEAKPVATLKEAHAWLEAKTAQMVRDCRTTMKDGAPAYPPQIGKGYGAFWLRDYSYIMEAGFVPKADALSAVQTFLKGMKPNGECVDCIKFDRTPIYKPGFGSMGVKTVLDGSPFFVSLVYLTWKQTGDTSLLNAKMFDALARAMNAIPHDPANGLVYVKPGDPLERCPYGFTDTVRKQGDCLFTSLLEIEASNRLAEMLRADGLQSEAEAWETHAQKLSDTVNSVFWDERVNLYRAATVLCREHDVWGSAFAVWLGIAPPERAKKIAEVFRINYAGLTQKGQVRHLLPGVYWTSTSAKCDNYQNGAFWGTASGWFGYTLNLVDSKCAERFFVDMVNDYMQRGVGEWVFDDHVNLPAGYMSSATLPLIAMRRMLGK